MIFTLRILITNSISKLFEKVFLKLKGINVLGGWFKGLVPTIISVTRNSIIFTYSTSKFWKAVIIVGEENVILGSGPA